MTETTPPAVLLREAAARIRELASAATPGPWRTHDTWLQEGRHTATVLSGEGNETDLRAWLPTWSATPWDTTRNAWNDADYIAAMQPLVGAALADWLEAEAERADQDGLLRHSLNPGPLAVARAILGVSET